MSIWQKLLALPFVAVGWVGLALILVCLSPFVLMTWAEDYMKNKEK